MTDVDVLNHNFTHHEARKTHTPRLTNLLANFGITLPDFDAAGKVDVATLDATFKAKRSQYPFQFTEAKQAEICSLLVSMGRI
jgi:hypothetical protein